MAEPRRTDGFLLLLYGLLLIIGLVLLVQGVISFMRTSDATLLALGVVSLVVPAALFPIASALRDTRALDHSDEHTAELVRVLRAINENVALSDMAKRIAHRGQDREALRRTIREDIERGEYDEALVLVSEMAEAYGNRQEAEDYRDQIGRIRAAELERKVSAASAELERLLGERDWERASQEAAKIQRLYPESAQARELPRRVREARDQHKRDLEREFLQAYERDETDRSWELLRELDKYLTPAEAEPFREMARGIIGKQRENLGVKFKLAVNDREWTEAVRTGEHIIREFPNTRMADEVRGMLDLIRERAASEQAARPREAV